MRDSGESHFKGLKIYYLKKVVLPERVKCGGPEGEIVLTHGCQKRKKLICGTEGEIVVAHGRLPSPAPSSDPTQIPKQSQFVAPE